MPAESATPPPTPDAATVRLLVARAFDGGADCAQSLVRALVALKCLGDADARTALAAATGLGRGLGGTHGPCGALTGGCLVLNLACAARGLDRAVAYAANARLSSAFRQRFGAMVCAEVRRKGCRDCREITIDAAELVVAQMQALAARTAAAPASCPNVPAADAESAAPTAAS